MMKLSRSLLILVLAAASFGGSAYAQQAQPQSGSDSNAQLMQRYRQKSQELQRIQEKAVQNTPTLAAEMKQYQAEVDKSMSAQGYDVAKGQKHVEALVAKLKSDKKMSKAERMSIIKSFQAERQKMMKARTAAMQDPKIQKDGKALQADMIAAMKKQDSHTAQLIADVTSLRSKLMASMRSRQAPPKS